MITISKHPYIRAFSTPGVALIPAIIAILSASILSRPCSLLVTCIDGATPCARLQAMARTVVLLLCAALLALWITSALRQQPSVTSDEHVVRAQMTAVAAPAKTQ